MGSAYCDIPEGYEDKEDTDALGLRGTDQDNRTHETRN